MKREYRRHLPHQIPDSVPLFLTWNLKGALPPNVIQRLEQERRRLEREPPQLGESVRQRALRHGKLIFARADELLDSACAGPLHLREPACAEIVQNAILFGATERYELLAWCVMANHVHVLLTPIWELAKVTQGLKGFTAWKINQLRVGQAFQPDLNKASQAGKPDLRTFWQDESFDHWVRDEDELLRIAQYIENNPVKAGLCQFPHDWPWSSARVRTSWPVGQPFQADKSKAVRLESLTYV
jgi:REP-associated tyrosine transposase